MNVRTGVIAIFFSWTESEQDTNAETAALCIASDKLVVWTRL